MSELPWQPRPIDEYRDGGVGFGKWVEDFCYMPIYAPGEMTPSWIPMSELPQEKEPNTGRSYQDLWDNQKRALEPALEMDEHGRFKHRMIILCWPRGEGKSAVAMLIQLWKFFCWPRQLIVLGANSKDQTKFVHFDIARDIILNSPRLLRIIGRKNIQEKEIRLKDETGDVGSFMRPISSFSGIVSNITGYTFSEIFDLKNDKFFWQLDGSMRNIPNALATIDSTVSSQEHLLFQLYTIYKENKDPTLFFSYRYSMEGKCEDYWHPANSQKQLDSYKAKFPGAEFARYFLNVWSAGVNKLFTEAMVDAMKVLGVDRALTDGDTIMKMLKRKAYSKEKMEDAMSNGFFANDAYRNTIQEVEQRLWSIEEVYRLHNEYKQPQMATLADLEALGKLYNTDFAVLAGVDRADPMKSRTSARTTVSLVAKGLPNSKNAPLHTLEAGAINRYIYFLLHFAVIETSSLEDIKFELKAAQVEFDGIDKLCAERWGMWDIAPWCDEQQIPFEAIMPTYDKQKEGFSELFILASTGRLKMPRIYVRGSRKDDIMEEELINFDHDPVRRWYGSPGKDEVNGIQDDAVYSLNWGIYGGREISAFDFHPRGTRTFMGLHVPSTGLVGKY